MVGDKHQCRIKFHRNNGIPSIEWGGPIYFTSMSRSLKNKECKPQRKYQKDTLLNLFAACRIFIIGCFLFFKFLAFIGIGIVLYCNTIIVLVLYVLRKASNVDPWLGYKIHAWYIPNTQLCLT